MAALRRTAPGEYLAEVIGTFVLICFGDGVVAMAVAALNQSGVGIRTTLIARGEAPSPGAEPRGETVVEEL